MKRGAILLALLLFGCASSPPDVKTVVQEFGRRLKKVSLLAPKQQAAQAIRANYADVVDPALLAKWLDAPATAPGRQISSPWPDRIDVEAVDQSDGEAIVTGVVVEMTSTGEAGRIPVRVGLRLSGDRWLISSFEESKPAPQPPVRDELSPARGESSDQGEAVAVVQQYYRAIASRDFRRAYALWAGGGPPGQSFEQFVDGFRDTATVEVETGTPSRVGAAAGSRYIEIPVVVNATTKSGAKQRFEGTYTLQRSVADGATAEQRKWHLYRASLRPTAAP